jgi:hypothetical protein
MTRLPIVIIGGKAYYNDERLRQFRRVDIPWECIEYNELTDYPPVEDMCPHNEVNVYLRKMDEPLLAVCKDCYKKIEALDVGGLSEFLPTREEMEGA